MNYVQIAVLLAIAFITASCAAPRAAIKAGYDFNKIRTIQIGEFTASANQPNSGSVVSGEFMRQFLSKGYAVKTSAASDVDAVLEGNVSEYIPNNRYLVQKSKNNPKGAHISRPIEISGSNVYNLGSAFGLENSQIIVSNATVGISAYLKDPKSGEVVWSNSYTYEGLDLNTALEGCVRYILRSLPPDK